MKKVAIAVAMLLLVVTAAGCGHEHTWTAATCTEPKTCGECGETEGEALGHTWTEATCTQPKTCGVCGETEGKALGHTWTEATCTEPKTCSVCGATEGEALGHDAPGLTCEQSAACVRCNETIAAPGHQMAEATCTKPKTCSVCGATEGEALGHTTTNGVCARCGFEIYETVRGKGDDVVSDISVGEGVYKVHFTNTGSRNFIVHSFDASNDKSLLVNVIGSYDGDVILLGKAPYTFEIKSSGSWTFTVERVGTVAETSFSGKGDSITGMFSASSGTWQFTHDGKRNFIVKLYTTKGRDLIVNEIGAYNGKKMITIPSGSNAMFQINADGNWTAAPVQ